MSMKQYQVATLCPINICCKHIQTKRIRRKTASVDEVLFADEQSSLPVAIFSVHVDAVQEVIAHGLQQ